MYIHIRLYSTEAQACIIVNFIFQVSLLESPGRPGTPSTGQRSDIEVACCAASALWSCSKSKKNKLAMLKAGIVPLLAQHLQADEERLLVPIIGTIQECASEVQTHLRAMQYIHLRIYTAKYYV